MSTMHIMPDGELVENPDAPGYQPPAGDVTAWGVDSEDDLVLEMLYQFDAMHNL